MKTRQTKWKDIFASLVITGVPFEYIRKITIYYNYETFVITSQKEFEDFFINQNRKGITIDMKIIDFDIDFDYRKVKKEVNDRVDLLFSKYFVS